MASSSSVSRTSTVLTIVAGVTIVGGFIAYAAYFDYKRRNDADFRKKLRKEKKRVKKVAETEKSPALNVDIAELRAAVEKIRGEEVPESSTAREEYFMQQVGMGEQLCAQGPALSLPAALAFFRALRVYPTPLELIMIYEKTVPPEVFKLVLELMNLDARSLAEGYYNHFPPKALNVSIQENEAKRKIMVTEKDFEAGEIIYTEQPVATVLDADLQEAGSHCTHCLRLVHKATAVVPENDPLNSVYCSEDCRLKSKAQSQGLLFYPEPILPEEVAGQDSTLHAQSQKDFVEFIKSSKKFGPLLVARYCSRQVSFELAKIIPSLGSTHIELPQYIEKGGHPYALADHFERLRYVDVKAPEGEDKIVRDIFATAFPGMDQFLTAERHMIMLGKVAYNAIGICYSGGRDDKPASELRPEDQERTRTPYGTDRQIGSGLYLISAYLNHACNPSVKPVFKNGTAELHLVANRAIKKGEELTMAYVDVTQREGETADEARRRRRYELARGWRFKCECARCTSEDDAIEGTSSASNYGSDESKLEGAIERMEKNPPSFFADPVALD